MTAHGIILLFAVVFAILDAFGAHLARQDTSGYGVIIVLAIGADGVICYLRAIAKALKVQNNQPN